MAKSETGWTTTFPTIVGFYFVRTEQYRELPAEFDGQAVAALHGARFFPDDLVHHHPEFLGPFTVSDAEQLMGLRKAGTRMLEVLETYKERHLVPAYLVNAMADLRDALGGVDRTVTVQCADCLAWFGKNANHTCRQQVRRNQRSVK